MEDTSIPTIHQTPTNRFQPSIKRERSMSGSLEKWQENKERDKRAKENRRYVVFAADTCKDMAIRLQLSNQDRFRYFPIDWGKFPDGTDDITISGFHPENLIAEEHVLFFASFHNNDVTLSQFSVLIVLLQSFIKSMTIVLPFYPVGTNERVVYEGKVATANTYSTLLSNLPTCGRPSRIMIYDIHALQERFYFHGNTISSLHTSIPLVLKKLEGTSIKTIAFPDDGAAKRFSYLFKAAGFEDIIVCGKVRDGDRRIVNVQDGCPAGKDILIVDDLVQTGGTLHECALALKSLGANKINAFVTHGVFPHAAWKQFSKNLNGSKAAFDKFWITNSIPSVTHCMPKDDVFEVIDLLPQIYIDLDTV